jgi:hypothetical protein
MHHFRDSRLWHMSNMNIICGLLSFFMSFVNTYIRILTESASTKLPTTATDDVLVAWSWSGYIGAFDTY